jgi:ABC-type branched-subunit amino acid transport system substrate-binding protein
MTRRLEMSVLGAAALLVAALAAPAAAQSPAPAVTAAPIPSLAPGAKVPTLDLRYGVLGGLTGDAAASGQAWNQAVKVAVDDVANTVQKMELGDKIKVSLVASEDSQGSQTAGVEAAKKLAEVDKANVVIGDFYSGVTIATFQSVFQPGNILQFTGGTSPSITDMEKGNLLWRPVASDALQGAVLAQLMGETFGKDATVNVVARNDAYGTGLAQVFQDSWTKAGGKIGKVVQFNPEQATLDTEAQEAVQGNPGAWLMITFCGDFGKLKGPLTRTGSWDPAKTFGSDTLAFCTGPDAAAPGMRGTIGNASAGSTFPAFQSLFEASAPKDVQFQGFTAEAFDSVYLAFLAALAAGSDDPAKIGAQVQAISAPPGPKVGFTQLGDAINSILTGTKVDFDGASGPIDFNAKGDITANLYDVWEAQADGSPKMVKTITFNPGS